MPIKTGDALAAKVRWAFRAKDGLNETITGTVPGGTIGMIVSTAQGDAYVPATAVSTWQQAVPDLDPYATNSFTLFWRGYITSNTGNTLLQCQGPNYGWLLASTAYAGGWFDFFLYSKFSGSARYSNAVTAPDGLHSLVARFDHASGNVEFIFDGVSMGPPNWWIWDTTAIDPTLQTFGMVGAPTDPAQTLTMLGFQGYLSDSEIATLVADPDYVFAASATVLTGSPSAQANTGSTATIGIVGILFGSPSIQSNTGLSAGIWRTQILAASNAMQSNASSTASIDPYARLRGLLRTVNKGAWIQVNTTRFYDCTIPAVDDAPGYTSLTHGAVAKAWPSFAWDADNGNLILWGGGHANYGGNEIYIWDGSTGAWARGSLPSALDSYAYVPDKSAPQSSHTYSNNIWLPINRMFATFGGAAAPSGGPFAEIVAPGAPPTSRRVGPWLFDLALSDANKVGGTTGSGWDTAAVKTGSNAWYNRRDYVDGTYPIDTLNHINGATIYRTEDGHDVCYFTMDAASGFPFWYRYQFGDVRAGERDTCAKNGETWNSVIYEGFGVYDSSRGMFYRNGTGAVDRPAELAAQHLDSMTGTTHDTAINIVDTLGDPFVMSRGGFSFGASYNENDDLLYLWNGVETGTYYTVAIPAWDAGTGWASTTWIATEHVPAGIAPRGGFQVSVLGRMRYVPALKAIVVMDKEDAVLNLDPGVWMLKTTEAERDLTVAASVVVNGSIAAAIVQVHQESASACLQANACSAGALIAGTVIILTAAVCAEGHLSQSGSITQSQLLIIANAVQANACSAKAIVLPGSVVTVDAPAGNGPWLRTEVDVRRRYIPYPEG